MRNFVFSIIAAIFVIQFGGRFLFSEKFQAYGDKTKAPWTCLVSNVMAGLFETMSEYQKAYDLYDRVAKRCPAGNLGERAMYRRAASLESLGLLGEARLDYEAFLEAFPKSENAVKAKGSIDRIRFAR